MKKTVSVPIGPVHPALKEPIRANLELDGERVVSASVEVGYVHRGIEWIGLRRNPIQSIYIAERVCGICSISHPFAYTQAIEEAGDIEVPERADYIRTIIAELERIHSHALWAGVAAHEIGFDTLMHYTWKVREKVLDVLEYLTGNRVNYAMFQIGGVRRDITKEQYPKIIEAVEYYRGLLSKISDLFLNDVTIRKRTRNIGVLSKQKALELCAVGPTARASGVKKDIRYSYAYGAYGDIGIEPVIPDDPVGDVYDRILVRVLEIGQSCDIIEHCLDAMPSGEIIAEPNVSKLLFSLRAINGEGFGKHEAPRGEVVHYIRFEGKESPTAWKIRAPTYNNIQTWPEMLMDEELADVPIILASIDPCISCTDRITVKRGSNVEELTSDYLHKLSVEKTRRLKA